MTTATVLVDVDRNLNDPRMSQAEYTADILETQPLGVSFTQVAATDDDQRVTSSSLSWLLQLANSRFGGECGEEGGNIFTVLCQIPYFKF